MAPVVPTCDPLPESDGNDDDDDDIDDDSVNSELFTLRKSLRGVEMMSTRRRGVSLRSAKRVQKIAARFYGCGGAEGVAMLLRMASGRDEDRRKLVEDSMDLMIHCGFVGALLMSMSVAVFTTELHVHPSITAIPIFDQILRVAYVGLFALCFASSTFVTMLSVRVYMHLSFWMPDLATKLKYLQGKNLILPIIEQTIVAFTCVLNVIPVGALLHFGTTEGTVAAAIVIPMAVYTAICHIVADVHAVERLTSAVLNHSHSSSSVVGKDDALALAAIGSQHRRSSHHHRPSFKHPPPSSAAGRT